MTHKINDPSSGMVTILSTCIEEWSGLVFIDSSLDDGKGEKLNMIKE